MTTTLHNANCLDVLQQLPAGSVDMIFADPPYNLSGQNYLTVQNGKPVKLYKGDWDVVDNIDDFNQAWIGQCLRVLSDNGTIWISGTLHNHPSVGMALKKTQRVDNQRHCMVQAKRHATTYPKPPCPLDRTDLAGSQKQTLLF